jgi:hypothetical protein
MAVDLDSLNKHLDSTFAALKLFHKIENDLGLAEARRIFAMCCATPTARQRADLKNTDLLALYDSMEEPNIQQLARLLAKANKTLPPEDRYGPRGSADSVILDKHIRRLVAKRAAKHRAYRALKAQKHPRPC